MQDFNALPFFAGKKNHNQKKKNQLKNEPSSYKLLEELSFFTLIE